ncbi:MAG: protease Do, partial [Thiothrix lacustris]
MFTRNKRVIAVGLLMSSVLVLGTLSASAETAQTFPLPQAPAAAAPLVGAAIAPAPAPVVGSLPELTTLIKQNGAAVVSISVEGKSSGRAGGLPEGLPPELERFFRGLPDMEEPEARRTQASGSGFIISADGYIVTNAHVVEDAKSVTVGLGDRRELSAEIVGVDTLSDIA